MIVREGVDAVDAFGGAEATQREGQVFREGQHDHVLRQLRSLLVEAARLCGAHLRVDRREDGQDHGLALEVRQADGFQALARSGKFGRSVAHFDQFSEQRHRVSCERYYTLVLFLLCHD